MPLIADDALRPQFPINWNVARCSEAVTTSECIDLTPPVRVQLQLHAARPWRPAQQVGIKGNRQFYMPPSGRLLEECSGHGTRQLHSSPLSLRKG